MDDVTLYQKGQGFEDVVIGCIAGYTWKDISPWVVSLDRCGFIGQRHMICYGIDEPNTIQKLIKYNFKIHQLPKLPHPALTVVQRFYDMSQLLHTMDVSNLHAYVIATDVKDVVFQNNPSIWLRKKIGVKHINVGSEGLEYQYEPWGNQNMKDSFPMLYERMRDKIIYNAGTVAGSIWTMRDLFMNIYLLSINNPRIHNPDQAALNVLLRMETYESKTKFNTHNESWACQAGTTADPSKIASFRPFLKCKEPIMDLFGTVVNSESTPYTLVHQYDRVPEWKKIILDKYKE